MNNKRYMDFVPTKAKHEAPKVAPKAAAPKVAPKPKVVTPKAAAPKVAVSKIVAPKAKAVAPAKVLPKREETVRQRTAIRGDEPELGVIEDLSTDSRVISRSHFSEENDGIRAVKAKKVGMRESTERPSTSGLTTKPRESDKTFRTPKSPFINQDKVTKRPLSKNVYQKKVVVPKEEPKGPVTIITKPEKQAHVSLIVTIILTIILGAAAGTVAFLLLPK